MDEICSNCKNKIDDFYIDVNLGTRVFRKTAQDTKEEVANGNLCNKMVLCKDCFDKFANTLLSFGNNQ